MTEGSPPIGARGDIPGASHEAGLPVPGDRIAGLEVLRELGRGGMGVVYEAFDAALDRPVALKLALPSGRAASSERFAREARALARLRHRAVPLVFSVGAHEGVPYFTMELIAGRPLSSMLAEHLTARVAFPLRVAVSVIRELAEALDAAHAQGIIHRDVKPDNVLIEHRTGRVVLVDFGLAYSSDEKSSPRHSVIGTPEYYAPELTVPSAQPTPLSDQYQLGCVAYELLVGTPPFGLGGRPADLMHAHRHLVPLAPSASRASLRALDAPIARALAKHPADRFPSMRELASSIEATAAGLYEHPASDVAETDEVLYRARGSEPSLRVLVVDDDVVFGRFASRCAQIAFASRLLEVSRAKSIAGALESIRRRVPDVLVLDHYLLDGEGTDLVARMRWIPGTASTRAVVVSSVAPDSIGWRYAPFGVRAIDVMSKPMGFAEMVERLADLVRMDARVTGSPEVRDTPTRSEPG